MRLGIHVAEFNWPGGPAAIASGLSDIAQAAETAGVYHVSVMDHYFQIPSFAPAGTRCWRVTPRSGSSPPGPSG